MAAQFSAWDSWNAMWKFIFLFLACLFSHCIPGVSHGKLGGHHYFLSWREPWHKFEDWDWFNGRNFCRERCMDLVSFENPTEFRMFEEVMIAGKATMGSKTFCIYIFYLLDKLKPKTKNQVLLLLIFWLLSNFHLHEQKLFWILLSVFGFSLSPDRTLKF